MQRAANVSAKAQAEDEMMAADLRAETAADIKGATRAGADMPKKADATMVLDAMKDSAHNVLTHNMHQVWKPMAMATISGAIVGADAAARNATNSRKASINTELRTDADQVQLLAMQ